MKRTISIPLFVLLIIFGFILWNSLNIKRAMISTFLYLPITIVLELTFLITKGKSIGIHFSQGIFLLPFNLYMLKQQKENRILTANGNTTETPFLRKK